MAEKSKPWSKNFSPKEMKAQLHYPTPLVNVYIVFIKDYVEKFRVIEKHLERPWISRGRKIVHCTENSPLLKFKQILSFC